MDETTLLWPECLGSFDEESCRFFLRELGQRVVQFYPFSVGIQEVFSQIIEEYDFSGAADVLSVLHELLEDDATAAGIGDDGDIWRSWRHSWRHRNNDPRNPHTPRARGRILPPPTSARIRLLKSANFIALQQRRTRSKFHNVCLPTDESLERAAQSRENIDSIWSNDSPVVEHYHQVLLDGIDRGGGSTDHRRHSPKSSSTNSQPSEGDTLLPSRRYSGRFAGTSTCSSRRSMPVPPRRSAFQFDITSPKRRSSTGSPTPRNSRGDHICSFGVDAILEEDYCTERTVSSNHSPVASAVETLHTEKLQKTPLSQRVFHSHENRYSLPSDLGSTDYEVTPTNKRSFHRQARMIDGALFHGKAKKGKCLESDSKEPKAEVKVIADGSSMCQKLSWSSSQQSPRASWLHNVLTRFQGKQNRKSKQQPKLRKRHSGLADCGMIGQHDTETMNSAKISLSPIVPEMKQIMSLAGSGLDGAFDIDDERSNKPLPLSPFDQSARPSLQSEIQRNFFGLTPETTIIEFDDEPSPGVGKFRQHDELRSLVSATMSGPQELSPKDKALRYRFSDASSQSAPSSTNSFSTFRHRNACRDSTGETSSGLPQLAPLTYDKTKVSSTVWPFRDANDAKFDSPSQQAELEGDNLFLPVQRARTPRRRSIHIVLENDDQRGRGPAQPPVSASKPRSGFNDRSSPEKPRPRSRSPVKKLLGIVKSMSTNQIPTQPSPRRTTTPASQNKKKWKELSNKLRNGFLTADIEQLEQEELMEQYTTENNEAIQIITSPSSHDRIVFPVSIKSSGQSKLWSELEYMLIETCNTFLKDELKHGRVSREGVLRIKRQWQARNRPQIIEFYYDQATQCELIISNLRTIKLYSDYAQDAIMLNSVLHQWKVLIRELSAKTLCMPDSIIRRWLHDGRRVLELLGASQVTLANMDKLTSLCMAVIGSAEKERAQRRVGVKITETPLRQRSASDGSQATLHRHEQALLRGDGVSLPPPTPSTISTGPGSRKVTPQQLQEELQQKHQQRKVAQAKHIHSRTESVPFIFSRNSSSSPSPGNGQGQVRAYGHRYSRSYGFTPSEERARVLLD